MESKSKNILMYVNNLKIINFYPGTCNKLRKFMKNDLNSTFLRLAIKLLLKVRNMSWNINKLRITVWKVS